LNKILVLPQQRSVGLHAPNLTLISPETLPVVSHEADNENIPPERSSPPNERPTSPPTKKQKIEESKAVARSENSKKERRDRGKRPENGQSKEDRKRKREPEKREKINGILVR
jgi:hypothetical protein